jgi:hypothetical protein
MTSNARRVDRQIDVEYAETVTVEAGASVENSTGESVGSGAAA